MARVLLVLLPFLLAADGGPGPDFPAQGERLATVLYQGADPAGGPALAALGYDVFRAERAGEAPEGALGVAVADGRLTVGEEEIEGTLTDLATPDSPAQKALRRSVAAQAPLPPLGMAGVEFVPSPNWSVRPLGTRVDAVVLHSTVEDTLEGTVAIFLDTEARQVSAHYVVDRDGKIVQMVDERLAAHHAGVSELAGRQRVNEFSVGIEMVNRNDGIDPYPEAQVQAVAALLRDLRRRWDLPDERVVSHAQVARPVGRKSDPLGFDFARLCRMASP